MRSERQKVVVLDIIFGKLPDVGLPPVAQPANCWKGIPGAPFPTRAVAEKTSADFDEESLRYCKRDHLWGPAMWTSCACFGPTGGSGTGGGELADESLSRRDVIRGRKRLKRRGDAGLKLGEVSEVMRRGAFRRSCDVPRRGARVKSCATRAVRSVERAYQESGEEWTVVR